MGLLLLINLFHPLNSNSDLLCLSPQSSQPRQFHTRSQFSYVTSSSSSPPSPPNNRPLLPSAGSKFRAFVHGNAPQTLPARRKFAETSAGRDLLLVCSRVSRESRVENRIFSGSRGGRQPGVVSNPTLKFPKAKTRGRGRLNKKKKKKKENQPRKSKRLLPNRQRGRGQKCRTSPRYEGVRLVTFFSAYFASRDDAGCGSWVSLRRILINLLDICLTGEDEAKLGCDGVGRRAGDRRRSNTSSR